MHLKKDIDIQKFLEDVKKCAGTVYYKTPEGDILNLSSTLSRFVFCTVSAMPDCLDTGFVQCVKETDYILLKKYLTGNDNT